MTQLKEGSRAPAFSLEDQEGKTVKLADFKGRKLLVYFYPKADTPGCTTQSCSVRDSLRCVSHPLAGSTNLPAFSTSGGRTRRHSRQQAGRALQTSDREGREGQARTAH